MSKWLISKALEHSGASADAAAANAPRHPVVHPSGLRRRSPTGCPALPSEWLFSVALEPVIIVEAATQRILQANPAAAQLLHSPHTGLIGAPFIAPFDAASSPLLERCMAKALATGAADTVSVHSASDGAELSVKLSLFRADSDSYFLVHLAWGTGVGSRPVGAGRGGSESPVFDAIDGASVGFLVTDSGLQIEYANQAFTDMVELASPDETLGKSLVRWLELAPGDLVQLRSQMLQRQATSLMTAWLRTESDSARIEVEICAVAVPDGPQTRWGFTVRELPRLN